MCWGASFIQVNAGRPNWKKPIPVAAASKQSTSAADSAGGMWQQDNQRMSGFNVMAATQARQIGNITGRAKYRKGIVPSRIRTIWTGVALAAAAAADSGSGGSAPGVC